MFKIIDLYGLERELIRFVLQLAFGLAESEHRHQHVFLKAFRAGGAALCGQKSQPLFTYEGNCYLSIQ